MKFVVLVCGGRHYKDYASVDRNLYTILKSRVPSPDDVFLVEGACHLGGADQLAYGWRMKHGIDGKRYPVDTRIDGPWPAAGNRRNERMFNATHPRLVVAFHGGNGTRNMVNYARRMGCEVIECL